MTTNEHLEQEMLQLVDVWTTAELHGDTSFLAKILADDFVGIGPLGFMLTKQEWLARHQSGDLKYESFTFNEDKVRVFENTAIVIGRQVQKLAYRGNSTQASFRTTLVFVAQQGQWRLANLQLSAIGQPPAFAQS